MKKLMDDSEDYGMAQTKKKKLDTTPKVYHASAQRIMTKEVVQNISSFLN